VPVPDFFHARFSAQRRHYRYTFFNRATRSALHAACRRLGPSGIEPRSVEAYQAVMLPVG